MQTKQIILNFEQISVLTILSSTILEISIKYHFLTNIGDVVVVIDTTLCDNVCPPTGRWIFPVSSTNKTDRHDITEILLKVVLNTNKPIIKNIIVNKTKVILAHALVIIADFGYPVQALQFLAPNDLCMTWLSNMLDLSVPGEGYSRKSVVCTKWGIYILLHILLYCIYLEQ